MPLGVHAVLVVGLGWQVATAAVAGRLGVAVAIVGAAAVLLLVAATRVPVLGLVAYLVVAHGVPRYGADQLALLEADAPSIAAAAALSSAIAAGCAGRLRSPGVGGVLRSVAARLFVAYLLWAGLSLAVALAAGPPGEFFARHHPLQLLQAALVAATAALLLAENRAQCWLIGSLCAVLLTRGSMQGAAGIYLDGDLPLLCAMVLPLALSGALAPPHAAPERLLFMAASLGLLVLIWLSHNRGAAIALAAAMLALWWHARHRWRWAAAFAAIAAAAAVWAPSSYADRFAALWNPQARHATASLDRATADDRRAVWVAALAAVRERPLLGVGPGRETIALNPHLLLPRNHTAHNSVLSAAVETGVPGALLFVLLFGAAVVLCERVIRDTPGRSTWPARGVQAAIAAYLAGGLVISRHDLVLAFLLVGWAAVLAPPQRRSEPAAGGDGR